MKLSNNLTPVFVSLFQEKNSDGTKNLVMRGNDMWKRKGFRLNDVDMFPVCQFIRKNPETVLLDLAYNEISDNGLETIVTLVLHDKSIQLRELNLVGNNLGPWSMSCLLPAADSSKLEVLRLSGNKIGDTGLKTLAMFVASNNSLSHIELADTDQTPSSLSSLLYSLTGDHQYIKYLDMSRIIPTYMSTLIDTVQVAANVSRILELHLQKNQLNGHDVETIIWSLQKNKTLRFLDLGYNRIGDHGAEVLAHHLATRSPLIGLNIAGNSIQDHGAEWLGMCLPYSRLRLLDISQNRIGPEGLLAVLNTLKKPTRIRVLFLWGNCLDGAVNRVLFRMMLSGVLEEDSVDFRIYRVDGEYKAAYLCNDHSKHRFYCASDRGVPQDLVRIKRNVVVREEQLATRAKVNFAYLARVPKVVPEGAVVARHSYKK